MSIEIKNTKVFISPLFFAVIVIILSFRPDSPVLIVILSSILHELSHIAALTIFGCLPKEVTLSFYGMKMIKSSDLSLSFSQEIIVYSAGCAVNFMIFALFAVINLFFPNEIYLKISAVNMILGVFNLLPVFSLDGGKVLEFALKKHFTQVKSEKILNAVSFCFIIPLYFFGFFTLIKTRSNFTLLICALYLTISSLK